MSRENELLAAPLARQALIGAAWVAGAKCVHAMLDDIRQVRWPDGRWDVPLERAALESDAIVVYVRNRRGLALIAGGRRRDLAAATLPAVWPSARFSVPAYLDAAAPLRVVTRRLPPALTQDDRRSVDAQLEREASAWLRRPDLAPPPRYVPLGSSAVVTGAVALEAAQLLLVGVGLAADYDHDAVRFQDLLATEADRLAAFAAALLGD